MTEIQLIKRDNGMLAPANQVDADVLQKIGKGALVHAQIKQPRNPKMHAKFFAMISFAFDYFEPEQQEWRGIPAQKNFDRFRKDVLILAGYRQVTYNIKGEVKVEADSISFSSMDETKFQEVYSACFEVCWDMVLSEVEGLDRGTAENVINQMLSFD